MSTQAYDIVKLARATNGPRGLDYVPEPVRDFLAPRGDHSAMPTMPPLWGAWATSGIPVTFVAIEKGHSARADEPFLSGHPPGGYRKALRLMRQAGGFTAVLCFVDTSGAYCGMAPKGRARGGPLRRTSWA